LLETTGAIRIICDHRGITFTRRRGRAGHRAHGKPLPSRPRRAGPRSRTGRGEYRWRGSRDCSLVCGRGLVSRVRDPGTCRASRLAS
jgi:hypothetical protein